MKDEIWVVEYNSSNKNYMDNHAWCVQKLENLINSNLYCIVNRKECGSWVLIATATSCDECKEIMNKTRNLMYDQE